MDPESENPSVLVHLPPGSSVNGRSHIEVVESLRTAGIDGVVLDLYRTSRLVSRIHAEEEADRYREHQLDRDEFLDLYDRFDNATFDVVGRLYDPDLVEWYAEETDDIPLQIHGGDITYKRLLESAASVPRDVVLTVKAVECSDVEQALEWLEGPGSVLLLHEEYESGDPRPQRYRRLTEWDLPRGLADPSGAADVTRTVLASSRIPQLWQPRLAPEPDRAGYDVETIQSIATELKESDATNSGGPEDDETDGNPWALTDRDRSYQDHYRRSLMADRNLAAGSTLKTDMVRELRPGSGLPAEEIDNLDGILIQRPTQPQEMITY